MMSKRLRNLQPQPHIGAKEQQEPTIQEVKKPRMELPVLDNRPEEVASQEIQELAVPVPTATAPPRGGVSVTATQSLDRDGTKTRKIQLLSADNFMDDTRTFTTVLRRGTRYCARREQFVWSRAWELEEAQDVSRRDTKQGVWETTQLTAKRHCLHPGET